MPAGASRSRAVTTAAALFRRQGYAATGVSQIIEESETPKGSFYFNFPGGKEQLGLEAIALAGDQLAGAIAQLAESASTPREFLRSLTDALAAGLEQSDFASGCPIATVALETATTSEPMRIAAEQQFAAWEAAIALGLARPHAPRRRHRDAAAQILMLLEGALIMGRVRRTSAPVRGLQRTFELLLA